MDDRERIVRGNGMRGFDMRTRLSTTDLRDLIDLMKFSDLAEITIEHETGGLRLTLRKPTPSIVPTAPAPARIAAATDLIEVEDVEEPAGERAAEPEPREKPIEVRAPLVGIFRASMKHDGAPLVRKGDMVRAGQVVGAIEALNVPNEVEVAAAGRVQELLVEDGEPVEYGQPLLLIAPATTISS